MIREDDKQMKVEIMEPLYPSLSPRADAPPPDHTVPLVSDPASEAPPGYTVHQVSVMPEHERGEERKKKAFIGQIVFSCLVTWCCISPCGIIAFILAVIAYCRDSRGHTRDSRRLGKASYGLSVIGLLLGFIFVSLIVGIYLGLLLCNRGYFKFLRG